MQKGKCLREEEEEEEKEELGRYFAYLGGS
jgi:hypothetical protein